MLRLEQAKVQVLRLEQARVQVLGLEQAKVRVLRLEQARVQLLLLERAKGPSAADGTVLGSFCLVNCHLGKYPWEIV